MSSQLFLNRATLRSSLATHTRRDGRWHRSAYAVFSKSTSTSSAASPPRVLSRQVWQAYRATLPKIPKPVKPKVEEKPWPRNVQLAGYAALTIFIPYSLMWWITSNPTVREATKAYLPLERFRKHFGEVEWDVQSYVERLEERQLDNGMYQFPLEDTYRVRCEQEQIEQRNKEPIRVRFYNNLPGDCEQTQQTKTLPASTRANPQTLSELTGKGKLQTVVAIDFGDDDATTTTTTTTADSNEEWSSDSGMIRSLPDDRGSSSTDASKRTKQLLQGTQTYSTWYHHYSPDSGQGQESSKATVSDRDIDISRLEYTITDLERSLKDPTCTRDIDDMRSELQQARRDLSRMKWKKRLGF